VSKLHTYIMIIGLMGFAGCSTAEGLFSSKVQAPPEYNQKIALRVDDDYVMHQAPRSGYDIGDLQAFHTQHTLPITIEGAFRDVFGQVEVLPEGAGIETAPPDVPAIFEVKIIDLAHDIDNGATNYRSQITLAVAMRSPRDTIFWQQAFRGEGQSFSDPQFGNTTGPADAILDALQDAINQMQKAIVNSPQIRAQMKYYMDIENARKEKEVKV